MLAAALLALGTSLVALQPPAASGSAEPYVSTGHNGDVLLSWIEKGSDRAALRFARLHESSWSAAQTIVERADLFVNWADFPSITEDAGGVLYAHWLQKRAASPHAYDVWMARSGDGGKTWGAPFVLNRDGKVAEHGFVSVAPLRRNGIAVVWLDGREGEMALRYATITARGRPSEDQVLDSRVCDCCQTGLAMTSSGAVAVYRDRSADEVRDISIVRQGRAPAPVHSDNWKINACPVNGPQIDSSGDLLAVAWFTAAGDHGRVYVVFSRDGGASFGEAIPVDDGSPVGRVDVVLDGGAAVVSWIELTGSMADIRLRRVTAGGAKGAAYIAAPSSAGRSAGFPRMTRSGDSLVLAWTDQLPAPQVRVARIALTALR